MRVLLLGATGTIGSAILTELLQHGHSVLALARSDSSEQEILKQGGEVIRGDLQEPKLWSKSILEVDAVIHAAATFCDDMGNIDRRVVDELISQGNSRDRKIRFIYTGGVWLYGQTGDRVATEESLLNPISSFTWMVHNSSLVLNAPCFDANIIHPGMTYDKDAGALSHFSPKNGQVEVWGSVNTRWPVVHRDDLAAAYRLVLEQGTSDQSYNVCSEQSVKVGHIAEIYTKRFNLKQEPLVRSTKEVIAENGDWAIGPTLDQCMSAKKIKSELGWRPNHSDIISEVNRYLQTNLS